VVGLAQQRALSIEVNKINSTGVVVGDRLRKVRVQVLDNGSDPARAASQAQQFAANGSMVAILGGATAGTAKAMAAVAEQHKIPLLATASADSILQPITDRRFVFKLGPDSPDVASLLTTSIRGLNLNRLALVAEISDHGDSGVSAVTTSANNDGRDVVTTVRIPVVAKNYKTQASRVMAAAPDAVIIWALAPTSGLFARALRDAKYAGPMFFDTGAASDDSLSAPNRGATVNSYLVAPQIMAGQPIAVTTPAELDQRDFFQQYTQLYGAFSAIGVFGADALILIAEAARRGKSSSRLRIRDELESAPFDGLAGEYSFSTISHGGVEADSLGLFQMHRTDWVKVD
jgi:branched-chain amino acid transport system substrate-binding protein